MAAPKTPPWKRKRPAASPHTKLSDADKARARRRAARAGRRYPNLVDNMWAAQTAKKPTKKPTKKTSKWPPPRR